jgi:hypothetical protein
MAQISQHFLYAFLLHAVLISARCQATSEHPKKHVVAFFIFGDSFLDAGNNNYINTTTLDQANFWPYGETFFKFPTGRFSDGRLAPDFIGERCKSLAMSFLFVQLMTSLVNLQILCSLIILYIIFSGSTL